mgnify:CR=1 FL=1
MPVQSIHPDPLPLVYTLWEAANLIRGNRTTIRRAADAGQLTILARGRGKFVEAASLHNWVKRGMPMTDGSAPQ